MKSNRKTLSVILFILAGICILAAIILFVRGHMEDRHMEESLDALRPTESPAETVPSSEPETIATATTESAAEEAVPAPEEVTRVPNPYADSFLANEDMGAWLQIPGTGIDYPVMWTPRDESYYLYRAFDGSENKNGCLILDTDSCLDPLSTNLIIHGHNMKSGAMFGNLTDYEDPDFYREHSTLTLASAEGEDVYEIFAAVETRVLYAGEAGYRYYSHAGALTEADFVELTGWLTKNALYSTGVVPSLGEQIVILSTCSYQTENGRFLVAARKIP